MSNMPRRIPVQTMFASIIIFLFMISSVEARGWDRERGFVQTMTGPSLAPLSESLQNGSTLYQNCEIRIKGFVVGRNLAFITDKDGNEVTEEINGKIVPTGKYRTFIHDAGRLGKLKLIIKVAPDEGETNFAAPARFLVDPVTPSSLIVYPSIAEDVLDSNNNLKPGYTMVTVNSDLIKGEVDENLVPTFEGNGIYKRVNRLFVRCTFLFDENGDLIRCVNCFFFFGK